MSTFRRHLIMSIKKKEGRLPSQYQEVEYIESTGTQYINAELILNQDSRVELYFKYTSSSSSARIFGARTTSTSRGFTISSTTGNLNPSASTGKNYISPQFGNQSGEIFNSPNIQIDTRYHLDFNKNNFSMTGTDYNVAKVFTNNKFTTEGTCLLFGSRNGTSAIVYAIAQIYYCTIWDNGVMVRDLIPCYRIADGEIGLYDLVNERFYANNGTGKFIKGADV